MVKIFKNEKKVISTTRIAAAAKAVNLNDFCKRSTVSLTYCSAKALLDDSELFMIISSTVQLVVFTGIFWVRGWYFSFKFLFCDIQNGSQ